jgi:hypothetical protein
MPLKQEKLFYTKLNYKAPIILNMKPNGRRFKKLKKLKSHPNGGLLIYNSTAAR